jgi:hypothetical protein
MASPLTAISAISARAQKIYVRVRGAAGALRGKGAVLKSFAAGFLAAAAVAAVIFALPLKTIEVESRESYYVTTFAEEPYTVTEPYTAEETREYTEVLVDDVYVSSPAGIAVPFTIDRPDALLRVKFDNPFTGLFAVVRQPNQVMWQARSAGEEIELELEPDEYAVRFRESVMWGQNCHIYVAQTWSEAEQVTRYREVTEYREVTKQVQKERTIVSEKKISLWKYIFD